MTPKDKASELINKFKLDPIKPICIMHYEHSKQCALIAVDEILNAIKPFEKSLGKDNWEEVKQEIKKL